MAAIFYVDPQNARIVAGQTPPKLSGMLGLIRFFLIAAILCINGAVFAWYTSQQTLGNAATQSTQILSTTGTLEGCRSFQRTRNNRRQTVYAGTYRYTANGIQYVLELEIGYCTESQIGARIPLYYLSTEPTRFHLAPELLTMDQRNNAQSLIAFAFVIGFTGAFFGVMGITYTFRRRRLVSRYRRATIADGEVLEVQEKTRRTKYATYRVYRMLYQFVSPQGEIIRGRSTAMRPASRAAHDSPYPGTVLKILYVHRRDFEVL